MLFYSTSMSGFGNPFIYRPCDVFIAMGSYWLLEDEFSYPIDPNLRNNARVHNTMRQEWAWLLCEQETLYDELVVISCQCLGDSHRRCQETRSTNFVKHWTTYEKKIIEWRYVLINIRPNSRFKSQWSVSCMSTHNTCNHFLLISFISQMWRCQMKSNGVVV